MAGAGLSTHGAAIGHPLTDLDQVPWADLHAARMPGNLRALASPDPRRRSRAERELPNDLHECSSELLDHTVPFLVHMMMAEPDPDGALVAALHVVLFPGRAATALPYLRRLCARTDVEPPGRTTALVILGLLAGAAGDRSDIPLLTRIAADRSDPARQAAGAALARIEAPDLPAVAVEAMVYAEANWDTYEDEERVQLYPHYPTEIIHAYLPEDPR